MFFRFLLGIFGFFLMVVGFCYLIIYINLFSFGYTFDEYFSYLVTRYECWLLIIGIIIEIIVIFRKGKNNVKRL